MKNVAFFGLILPVILVSGCMSTSGGSQSLANINFNDLSCEQIKTTFSDYKSALENGQLASDLLSVVSTNAASAAQQAKSAGMNIYYQAKRAAEPAIKAKGCNININ